MAKVHQSKLLTGNIYKIIKTDIPDMYAFGCGNGLYFATWDSENFEVSKESVFNGKYVTQICLLEKG